MADILQRLETPPGSPGASAPTGGVRPEPRGVRSPGPDPLAYFLPEATEHLESMTGSLLVLEQTGRSEDELGSLLRTVHTLKGAAYTVGCTAVGDVAHRIEDVLVEVRENRVPLTPGAIEALFASTTALRLLLPSGEGPPPELPAALRRALAGLAALAPGPPVPKPQSVPPASAAPAPGESPAPPASAPVRPDAPTPARPGVRVDLDRLDALMNLVGELVIARSRLDRRLVQLERVGELVLAGRVRMGRIAKDLEGRHRDPRLLRTARAGDGGSLEGVATKSFTEVFTELELDRYDDFNVLARRVEEISADLSEAHTQLAAVTRSLADETVQVQRLTGGLRGEITRARMVPIGRLFARFGPQVREAARAADKSVQLEIGGESVEVDNTIIEHIADPLLHLVRNAISHGIEPEDERRSRGKAPHGTVSLRASQRSGFLYVEVKDDGRGIDLESLKERAVQRGLMSVEMARQVDDREALNLIFLPGLSTAPLVTPGAGRGVGMDVVQTNIGRLNGRITVDTAAGVGTRFTLKVPLTVVISEVLLVRVGSETVGVPLTAIQRILMVRPAAIDSVGPGERLQVEGEVVDLVRLDRVLALPRLETPRWIPVLVLRAVQRSAAVAVDEVLRMEEVVVKGLGGFLAGLEPFAGAMVSGDGRVILLLEPAQVVDQTRERALRPGGVERPAPQSLPETARRVLLVDDSISVRKFVGHMLEKGGFRVTTAGDGAEALERLGQAAFDVVITDLEMPRVNGFELIQSLRRRPETRDIPLVVLTTRAGAKHLNLARWLGVKHYLAKPVDEDTFVRLIDSLSAPAPASARR